MTISQLQQIFICGCQDSQGQTDENGVMDIVYVSFEFNGALGIDC